MKVKDFSRGLKEKYGATLPEAAVLKQLIGAAFESEVKSRIKSRKLGVVERRASWGLKKELFMYGKALAVSVSLEIEQYEFDRIVDAVLEKHNKAVEDERKERMSKAVKPIKHETGPIKVPHHENAKPLTIGEALGG